MVELTMHAVHEPYMCVVDAGDGTNSIGGAYLLTLTVQG